MKNQSSWEVQESLIEAKENNQPAKSHRDLEGCGTREKEDGWPTAPWPECWQEEENMSLASLGTPLGDLASWKELWTDVQPR